MTSDLGERDSGLQPERTALSWHRTLFSSIVLAVVTLRAGFYHADTPLIIMGGASIIISLLVVVVSCRRQQLMVYDFKLTSASSMSTKRMICLAVGLNALAIPLYTVLRLF
ncbi:DUF202 domain-containing protein [Rahnella bruchi]|uniref:DUF202 domain-containing protein n=1 Tax=Rahnella bruchi TaxID=1510573 RepID=UPI000EA129FE|nr:DUF202 domain-containing protein [Rahnella bruchi]